MRFQVNVCYLCGEDLSDPIEWDHVLPRLLGGSDGPQLPVHAACNALKASLPLFVLADIPIEERANLRRNMKRSIELARARGVQIGRPPAVPESMIEKAIELKHSGYTLDDLSDYFHSQGMGVTFSCISAYLVKRGHGARLCRECKCVARQPSLRTITCRICNEKFQSKAGYAVYCSKTCRNIVRDRKKREKRQQEINT